MAAALAAGGWDLILSDFSLPQFNAPDALSVLRDSGQDLPFIIISGTITEDDAVTALRAGAHDFVVKGRLARLVPAIERELHEAAGLDLRTEKLPRTRANREENQEAIVSREIGEMEVEIVGGVGATLWGASLLAGGVNNWQLWLPPLVLLLTGRLLLSAWTSDRLVTRGPLVTLAGGCAATILTLAAGLGYRVLEIPDRPDGDEPPRCRR
jgi:CheY-like chemotaxis protein